MDAPVPSPPPPPPPAAAASSSALVTLPDAVRDVLRENNLKDPSTFNQNELDKYLAGAGAGALAVFLLPLFEVGFVGDAVLSGLVGGGAMAYAALRKDDVGDVATKVGGYSLEAVEKTQDLNQKYQVTDKFQAKMDELVKEIKKNL